MHLQVVTIQCHRHVHTKCLFKLERFIVLLIFCSSEITIHYEYLLLYKSTEFEANNKYKSIKSNTES